IASANIPVADALHTYCVHIAQQIAASIEIGIKKSSFKAGGKLLATGGGAFNSFLIEKLKEKLKLLQIEVVVPEAGLVNYKEALIMAFIGVLRWRQEHNVLSSVTGASRDNIGGALWMGQPA
ncbi:MAG TPA: anhydro-N-acetylmuramic acid kinase, partial [Chitinophagaceae bacterium]|nr:anhydro-N-acetylmuramic acid kinase [Chitinophagaceae bacterium]